MSALLNFPDLFNHIEILKPTYLSYQFPDSINLTHFYRNHAPKRSHHLPYPCYGGNITLNTSCLFKVHDLDFYLLIYVEKGQCYIKDESFSQKVHSGSFFLTKPQWDFTLETSTTAFVYDAYALSGDVLADYWTALSRNHDSAKFIFFDFSNQEYVFNTITRLNHLLTNHDDNTFFIESMLVQTLMTTLVVYTNNNKTSLNDVPKHVALAKEIMESQYYDSITLDELQNKLKINKYQLCRDFTKYLGISPLKYLNHFRINKAKDLLLLTNDTVHSIGDTVGIPNTTHFINLFKAETGLTPQQFRSLYSINTKLSP